MENDQIANEIQQIRDRSVIHTALLSTLRFVQKDTPSNYALARHVITAALLLPQECKGPYLKGVASFFRDPSGEDWKEWQTFRNKLMGQTLKAQAIVQAVATLLEDWQIQDADEQQLGLFAAAQPALKVNMTTGEVFDANDDRIIIDE
jgi:hypothetical protein